MATISQQQIFQRWDTLPLEIQEVICSDQSTAILKRICESQHLSPEKSDAVARIAGYTFMGFVHADDVAREIAVTLNMGPEAAKGIGDMVQSRLLAPYRDQLEKLYALPSETPQPKIIEEIQRPVATAVPIPAAVTAAVPLPKENVQPTAVQAVPYAPRGRAIPTPPLPAVVTATPSPSSEPFSKLTAAVPAPTPSVVPTPPPAKPAPTPPIKSATVPPPVFLHEESAVQPLVPKRDFRLEVPPPRPIMKGFSAPTPQPAKLELGASLPLVSQKLTSTRTEIAEPRVVHYSQLKTPLDKPPQPAPTGVSEAPTAGTPRPAVAPMPLGDLPLRNSIDQKGVIASPPVTAVPLRTQPQPGSVTPPQFPKTLDAVVGVRPTSVPAVPPPTPSLQRSVPPPVAPKPPVLQPPPKPTPIPTPPPTTLPKPPSIQQQSREQLPVPPSPLTAAPKPPVPLVPTPPRPLGGIPQPPAPAPKPAGR